MRSLRDRVLVITGGSSGIGLATARAAVEAGMRVVIAAREEQRLLAAARQVGAEPVVCDVAIDADVQRLIDVTLSQFGRLDAVYANAGYGRNVSVEAMRDADVRLMFEVNFFGTLRLIRAALPPMRTTPDGLKHVLICSSSASEIGLPRYGVYSASKAAQASVADALRVELEPEGFAVTSVHPIGTKTQFFVVATQNPEVGFRGLNTPESFMQSPQRVARATLKAMRRDRPPPRVWTSRLTQAFLALNVLFPRLGVVAMRRVARP